MKKNIKKLIMIAALITITSQTIVPTLANNINSSNFYKERIALDQTEIKVNNTKIVITDEEEISNIIEEDNLKVPEGYKLTEVIINEKKDHEINNEYKENNTYGISNIKNIHKENTFYYPKRILEENWYYGPATITETFSKEVKATFNSSVQVNANILSGALGFSVTDTSNHIQQFQTNIDRNEKLNIKVHALYERYNYDIYKWNQYKGSGTADRPVGLVIKQYRYAKR